MRWSFVDSRIPTYTERRKKKAGGMMKMKEEREVCWELDERTRASTTCDTNFIYIKLGFSILLESLQCRIWILVIVIDIDYAVVSSRERINPYHATRNIKCYEIQRRQRHFSIVILLQRHARRVMWKKCRTMGSIFIIRAGCSSRKKRHVVRKDNAGDFAIRIKRDDGFTVLEWSFTVELARSV